VITDPEKWNQARSSWLASKRLSANTVKAYRRDCEEFFSFAGKPPWEICGSDATAWATHLGSVRGLTPSTVNRKLSALASFFDFAAHKHTVLVNGVEVGLADRPNPFRRPDRALIDHYGRSRPLSVDVVRAALGKIDTSTPLGARDYALIVAYIYTGRRNREIRDLRWGDIVQDGPIVRYTWRGKGGKGRTDELPAPAYVAIREYLEVVDRWEPDPSEYIWRPIRRCAHRLPNVGTPEANRPISPGMINRIVKRRFVDVGVDPSQVHTHTLRHTAAHLRYRHGEGQSLLEISRFLGHSQISTTQIYLSKQHQPIDSGWVDVERMLSG